MGDVITRDRQHSYSMYMLQKICEGEPSRGTETVVILVSYAKSVKKKVTYCATESVECN